MLGTLEGLLHALNSTSFSPVCRRVAWPGVCFEDGVEFGGAAGSTHRMCKPNPSNLRACHAFVMAWDATESFLRNPTKNNNNKHWDTEHQVVGAMRFQDSRIH